MKTSPLTEYLLLRELQRMEEQIMNLNDELNTQTADVAALQAAVTQIAGDIDQHNKDTQTAIAQLRTELDNLKTNQVTDDLLAQMDASTHAIEDATNKILAADTSVQPTPPAPPEPAPVTTGSGDTSGASAA